MRYFIVCVLFFLTACGPEFERKTGQVFDNAGGIIKGSKQEVDNQWQPAGRHTGSQNNSTESQEEIQKRRRY